MAQRTLAVHALGTAVLREPTAGEGRGAGVAEPVRGSGAPSGSLAGGAIVGAAHVHAQAHPSDHKDIPFGGGTAARLSAAPPSVQLVLVQSGPGGRARWLLQRLLAGLVDLGLARHPRKDLDVCSRQTAPAR